MQDAHPVPTGPAVQAAEAAPTEPTEPTERTEVSGHEVSDVVEAVAALGTFAATLDLRALPASLGERATLVLTDLLGVTMAGARTPELRALLAAWQPSSGPAALFGGGTCVDPDAAALLNGTAACCLELDEGNKHAQGHPAAHVAFALLAQAAASPEPVPGHELLSAFVAGYEVAARFGAATRRRPELHTHGHWGAAGAAAAVARLRGLSPARTAAAIDASTGLVLVTPWSVVLAGSFVRNLWAAVANVSGMTAARLAAAGLCGVEGTAARTLGDVVGRLSPVALTEDLGTRWDITRGYLKQHSSCSYTHPAADAAIALRAQGVRAEDVVEVVVDTHRLTLPLAPVAAGSRVAAMFSVPYVVAVALQHGEVAPESFDAGPRADPATLALARRVTVRHDPDLDARLPAERANRVTVRLTGGQVLTHEQPNPVGDADFHPFDLAQVHAKLDRLVGAQARARLVSVVERLPAAPDSAALLRELA
ncbi:MAG: MmgE/PrpD family protein [Motilibacteraceae bacterium]